MNTPWGQSQSVLEIVPGIVSASTSSHGGVHVSEELNNSIPYARNENGWYEEDCEWSIVYVALRDYILSRNPSLEKICDDAVKTFKNWYPHIYKLMTGIEVKPEESFIRRREIFLDENERNLYVYSAIGNDDGTVRCWAVQPYHAGEHRDRKTVIVDIPKEKYGSRNVHGYVLDKEDIAKNEVEINEIYGPQELERMRRRAK